MYKSPKFQNLTSYKRFPVFLALAFHGSLYCATVCYHISLHNRPKI